MKEASRPGVYNFRIERIRGPVEEFARLVLAALQGNTLAGELQYKVIRDIYEDDGRGNIRDYILASFTSTPYELEVVFERNTRTVVNFKFSGNGISCEQRPFLAGAPLRLVGESSTRYILKAQECDAKRILRTIVQDLELCSLTGFKTDADEALSERRVQYILAGRDPDLVLHEFADMEHARNRALAFEHLNASMAEFPEFSAGIRQLYALLKRQKP